MDMSLNSASYLAQAIQSKEIGARELLEHYLKRVDRFDGKLNAIIVRDFERARKRSDEADHALSKGESWGLLHELPLMVQEPFMATFFKIRLPNALPSIFGWLKIVITLAVVGAAVSEFVGGDAWLGYLLMSANGSMGTPLFGGLVGLTLNAVVLFMVIEIAERLAMPWHASTRNTGTGETA